MNQTTCTAEEFINDFYRILHEYSHHCDAYEVLEIRHVRKYGQRKFKNYDSFKTVKCRKSNQ